MSFVQLLFKIDSVIAIGWFRIGVQLFIVGKITIVFIYVAIVLAFNAS